ncbi:glycosyltransferase, partial [Niallia circulans]|nr:glycosyltransferase [Niallia circulans]
MKKPKVSVIIPSFNREKYICDNIDSLLNQSLADIEIIIVDDCS